MKLFLVTVILILMVAGTWAIDCYTCAGTGCGDPFDSSATGVSDTCPNVGITYTHCLKVVSGSTVVRSCAPTCTEGCAGGACTYCCNTNLCNGDNTVTTVATGSYNSDLSNEDNTVTTSFVAMGVVMLAAFTLARQ